MESRSEKIFRWVLIACQVSSVVASRGQKMFCGFSRFRFGLRVVDVFGLQSKSAGDAGNEIAVMMGSVIETKHHNLGFIKLRPLFERER